MTSALPTSTRASPRDCGRSTRPTARGGNVLFYLATPPDFFGDIVEQLGRSGLTAETDEAWRRVIVEKPFGNSYDSARELNARLRKVLTEEQIYRIDHYLGKETVQNLLVFRFANGIFEPIWNRRYIDNVQITVAETVGVEQRGPLLRTRGGAARHGGEPPLPAPVAHRDGAALFASKPRRSGTRRARCCARCSPSPLKKC